MLRDIIGGNAVELGRRDMLRRSATTLGAGLFAASTPALAKGSSKVQPLARAAAPRAYALQGPLDFTSPETNLLGYVRLVGDSSGKPTWGWSHGTVYGTLEGELSTTLFDYVSCRLVEFKALDDASWVQRYRGLILMTDPKTGKVIDNFRNPYTDEDNRIIHFKTAFGAA